MNTTQAPTAPPDRTTIVLEQTLRQVARLVERVEAGQARLWQRMARISQRQAAMEARSLLESQGRTPCMPLEFRAQFGEDEFAWDLLGRTTTGFFIEVGAFDGMHFSVTYALEAMGWTGLLVEPHPVAYAKCAALRTRSRVVHAALGPRGCAPTVDFTVVDDQYGGMLSYSITTPQHRRQVEANGQATRVVTVPQTTLNDLLGSHAGPIDLAVLDVEGAEPALLDSFDLVRFAPRVLMIEDNTRGNNPDLDRAMQGVPYKQVAWLEVNRVYVHEDQHDVLARVAYL
jgi:FkbM family methyltransferase